MYIMVVGCMGVWVYGRVVVSGVWDVSRCSRLAAGLVLFCMYLYTHKPGLGGWVACMGCLYGLLYGCCILAVDEV
mgnify:FL=1